MSDVQAVNQAIQSFDSHLSASFLYIATDANGRNMGMLNVMPRQSMPEPLLPPTFASSVVNGRPEVTIRIQIQSAQGQFITFNAASTPAIQADSAPNPPLMKKVNPVYPELAKSARIQGVVKFTATIAPDGTVSKLELLTGHPLLVEAARTAVLQWVYQPSAAPIQTEISVSFTLQ